MGSECFDRATLNAWSQGREKKEKKMLFPIFCSVLETSSVFGQAVYITALAFTSYLVEPKGQLQMKA